MKMNSIINQTEEKNNGVKLPNFNLNLSSYANKPNNTSMTLINTNANETNKQTFKAQAQSKSQAQANSQSQTQAAKTAGKINFGAMLQRIEGMRGGCSSCGKKK